jgi:hypothetical protein
MTENGACKDAGIAESRSCKEIPAGRRPLVVACAPDQGTNPNKGFNEYTNGYTSQPVYTVVLPRTASRGSPARLAGAGNACHLQGQGGASA